MDSVKRALAAAALTFAAASVAADPAPVAAPKADPDERLVCFAEKTTGSNLRRRICRTPEEQERRRKEDQAAASNMRRSSRGAGTSHKD